VISKEIARQWFAINDENCKVYEALIVEWKSAMDNMKSGNYSANVNLDSSFLK
jgi:hypothetical protein